MEAGGPYLDFIKRTPAVIIDKLRESRAAIAEGQERKKGLDQAKRELQEFINKSKS